MPKPSFSRRSRKDRQENWRHFSRSPVRTTTHCGCVSRTSCVPIETPATSWAVRAPRNHLRTRSKASGRVRSYETISKEIAMYDMKNLTKLKKLGELAPEAFKG